MIYGMALFDECTSLIRCTAYKLDAAEPCAGHISAEVSEFLHLMDWQLRSALLMEDYIQVRRGEIVNEVSDDQVKLAVPIQIGSRCGDGKRTGGKE